jgi:hypothetical protein
MPSLWSNTRASVAVRQRTQLFFLFFCAATVRLHAGSDSQTTNRADLIYSWPYPEIENPSRMELLKERFLREVLTSDDVVFDRFFGPAPVLNWARKGNVFGYNSLDQFNSAGAGMFAKIGLDSLRTAAIEALPLESWQDHWLGGLGDFINGTIGNPEEEHIQLSSLSYSAVRSSWETSNRSANFQWGLRPWSSSPYLYFLVQAGHFESKPLLTLESRAGYTLFGASKIETRLAVQLPASFRLAGSASMNPGRINTGDPSASFFGVTLERLLGSRLNPSALFYIGFRSGVHTSTSNPRHENFIAMGFTKHW